MANKTNCTINGKEYYRIREKIGMKLNKNGKLVPDIKPFYGKNKTDAEKKIKEYWKKKEAGLLFRDAYFKEVADYFTYNVFVVNGQYASGTRELYERAYRLYIAPHKISAAKLDGIGSKDIQDLLNYLRDLEIPKAKGGTRKIGQASLKAVKNFLVLFFNYCEVEGYCKSPMKNVTVPEVSAPKPPNNDIIVFTDDEVEKIVAGIENERMRFLYLLALFTGIREGELLILRHSDFTREGVKITTQLVTRNKAISDERFREEDTKTSNSIRVVPLPEELWAAYERHDAEHKVEMKEKGYQTDFVFTTETGNFIDRRNLRRAHERMLKRVGVPYKKFHAFRATYATMLCKNNVPIQTAADLLGDDPRTVAKYYVFITSQEKQEAVNTLNSILTKDKVKKVAKSSDNVIMLDFDRVKKGLNS